MEETNYARTFPQGEPPVVPDTSQSKGVIEEKGVLQQTSSRASTDLPPSSKTSCKRWVCWTSPDLITYGPSSSNRFGLPPSPWFYIVDIRMAFRWFGLGFFRQQRPRFFPDLHTTSSESHLDRDFGPTNETNKCCQSQYCRANIHFRPSRNIGWVSRLTITCSAILPEITESCALTMFEGLSLAAT
jgi:hypothetical protein